MKETFLAIIFSIFFNVSYADETRVATQSVEGLDTFSKSSDDLNQNKANGVAAATKQAIKEGSGKESDSAEYIESENYRSISSEEMKNEN